MITLDYIYIKKFALNCHVFNIPHNGLRESEVNLNYLYLQLFCLFLFALPCILFFILFGAMQEKHLLFIHDFIFTRFLLGPKSELKSVE